MGRQGDFHHLIYPVRDLARAEAFYRDGLGLTTVGRDLWPGEPPTSTLGGPDGYVVLAETDDVVPEPPGIYSHVRFDPPDWQRMHARCRDMGYRVEDALPGELRPQGELKCHLRDPDGHVIEARAFEPQAFEISPAGRGKMDLGPVDAFPVGSVKRVPAGQFYLVRLGDGFLALSEVCTHQHFTVSYQPAHHRFLCPVHSCRYTRTGRLLHCYGGAAGVPPLLGYPIEITGDHIVVDTDRLVARTEESADEPMVQLGSPRLNGTADEVVVSGRGAIGATDSAASSPVGNPRADRRAIPVSDLTLAEEFYQDVLGPALGGYYVISRYPSTTTDLRRGRQAARLLARRGGEDLMGRTMHYVRVVVGRAHLILYLTEDDAPEPAPEQLRGVPRFAISASDEQIEDAMERFRARRIPFEGPVEHPVQCPAARSVYVKDPCGNFLELCRPRSTAA